MKTIIHVLCFLFCFTGAGIVCHGGERPKIVLAANNWAPYVFLDEQGTAQGVYIEILRELFETELGMELVFVPLPWKRAQLAVKNGEADFLVTVATPERREYAVASELPVLEMYLRVYSYAGHPRFEQIDAIKSGQDIKDLGLIPVTNIGNQWHVRNIDSFGVATEYVPAEENAFQMVAAKRSDITIEPIIAGRHLIKQLQLEDKIVATNARFGPLQMHLLLGKNSPHLILLPQINDALKRLMTSGRIERIIHRYTS